MAVFDVTKIITHSESIYDRGRRKNIVRLVEWLADNVGEYYGTGIDNTIDKDKPDGSTAIQIGSGWEIIQIWKGDPDGYSEVWWKLDITDEAKSTLFALKWIN